MVAVAPRANKRPVMDLPMQGPPTEAAGYGKAGLFAHPIRAAL
jgi:hypothetical protein